MIKKIIQAPYDRQQKRKIEEKKSSAAQAYYWETSDRNVSQKRGEGMDPFCTKRKHKKNMCAQAKQEKSHTRKELNEERE